MAVGIRQVLCPSYKYDIKCPYTMTPQSITIHNTANSAPAINEIIYMNRNDNYVSYHYAVDDVEVVQGIPINRNAWHAGDGVDGTGNRKSIGIEICYSTGDADQFAKAEKNAAWLAAKLLKQFGWGTNRMYRHYDWNGKNCPHRTMSWGWQRFVNMVQAELDLLNGSAPTPTQPTQNGTLYKVQVGAFKEKKNAVALSTKLKSKGYATYLVSEGGYTKVQVGAYADKANADKILSKLSTDGFNGFIVAQGKSTAQSKPSASPTPKPTATTQTTTGFNVGDSVVVTNPVDVNGTKLGVSGTYTVMEVSGSRIVIGRGGVVTAAISAGNIRKAGNTSSPSTASSLRVGARIRVNSGARDLNGGYMFADFVYANTYSIIEISGNRVVFGIGSAVTGVVDKSNIRLA